MSINRSSGYVLLKMREVGVTSLPVLANENKFVSFVRDKGLLEFNNQGVKVNEDKVHRGLNTVNEKYR